MLKNRSIIIDVCLIFCLSLLPFWWLKDGSVIAGHDAGTPLSPTAHFTDRLQTWTNRYNGGSDQRFAVAGFFIHGYEALLDQLPISLSQQQAVQFSTYFFLIGLSMYLFSRELFPEHRQIVPIFSAVFYQFNHFVLQAWFIAERTKFTTYIALPLMLWGLLHLFQKKWKPIPTGLFLALVLFVLNGGGFLPLYGALIIVTSFFCLGWLLLSKNTWLDLRSLLVTFLVAAVFTLGLQAYWLFPYISYVQQNFSSAVAESGGVDGVINWIASISLHTSYLNIFRGQGIQEWYVNPDHPYAVFYTGILPTVLSYLIPIFLAWILIHFKQIKQKNRVLLLVLTALISIFFMAGSHTPLGFLYVALIKYLPGFIAFRTPYYKFAPGFFVSVIPLLGLCVALLWQKYFQLKLPQKLWALLCVVLVLCFHFPFFTINFFQYAPDRTTRIQVPDHVFAYRDYLHEQQPQLNKILLLPGKTAGSMVYAYDWGYWSLASLHSLLDTEAYLTPTTDKTIDGLLTTELYQSMLDDTQLWKKIATQLAVDSVLFQTDLEPEVKDGILIGPEAYRSALTSTESVSVLWQEGPWTLYSYSPSTFPTQQSATNFVEVANYANKPVIGSFLYDHLALNPQLPVVSTTDTQQTSLLENLAKVEVIFPQCIDCNLSDAALYRKPPSSIFTAGSTLQTILEPFQQDDIQHLGVDSLAESSYAQLLSIRNLYERKEPNETRFQAWQKYQNYQAHYVEKVSSLIEQNLAKPYQNNAQYLLLYYNINNQAEILGSLHELIDTAMEAEIYFSVTEKLKQVQASLLDELILTKDFQAREFLVQIFNQGTYRVYAKDTSLPDNFFLNPTSFSLKVDNQLYPLADTIVADQTGWTEIADLSLEPGTHRVVLEGEVVKNQRADLTGELTLSAAVPCRTYQLGELLEDLYQADISLLSKNTEVDLSLHVQSNMEYRPLLPYWGSRIELSQNQAKSAVLPLFAKPDNSYQFSVCLVNPNQEVTLELVSFELAHYPTPILALAKDNQLDATFDSFTVTQETATKLSVQAPAGPVQIIPTQQRFSPQWVVQNEQFEVVRLNEAQLGLIKKQTEQPLTTTITYKPQSLMTKGWIVSLLTLTGALALFGWQRSKHV